MASPVKTKNTQMQTTIDVIFREISTVSPHIVTLDNVKKLTEALEKNQCFDAGHPKGGNRLNIFEDIKKKMTMNKESRATLISWFVNFAASYYTEFENREKIEGIHILMGPKMNEIGEPDQSKATEWLKGMCLKPVFDEGIPGSNSLSKSILISCKYENVDISSAQEDDLKKGLLAGIEDQLLSKTFDKYIPKSLYSNDGELKKMKRLYLALPICVLHASEKFKVNIRVLCFPSEEEVNFYNPKYKKTKNVTIQLGLIGEDTYVPLVKITEDDPGKVMSLKETIESLRSRIKELKETTVKTEKEKEELGKKIEMYEILLKKKEKEYREARHRKKEEAKITMRKAVQDAVEQVAKRYEDAIDRESEEDTDN